jgi:hypothetical protein
MKRALAWVVMVLLVYAFWNNAPMVLSGKRTAGHVVDATTGVPISGVHVALLWESETVPKSIISGGGRTVCVHAAAAVTDAQGAFDIPAWREFSSYRVHMYNPVALVYARGYVPRQIQLDAGDDGAIIAHPDERYALTRFSGSVEERMHMLFHGLANQDCMYGKDSQKSLYPFLKAIYDEGRAIAKTDEQRGTVEIVADLAAHTALATDPNSPSDNAAIKAFIREHMQ